MSNRNWSLATIIGQMYDPRPSSAWFTMLGMMASYARGNEAAQNRLIASELGVSERQVRRWRNDRVLPNRYQDQLYFASKLTRFLSPVRRDGARVLYPVGFLLEINEYAAGMTYAEIAAIYATEAQDNLRPGSPPPRIRPPALTTSQRNLQETLTNDVGGESGRMGLRFEYARSPNADIPVTVTRVTRRRGKADREEIYYESIRDYTDFFNPYDLPTMAARIGIAAGMIAAHKESYTALRNGFAQLHTILRLEYGFYSPGNSRLPNASLNRTVSFMHWFERILNMMGG